LNNESSSGNRESKDGADVPRRSVLEARQIFEQDVLPNVSDYQATEGRRRLEQIESDARAQADSYAAEREAEIREARDAVLRELTAVRDDLEILTAEGRSGRLPASEYSTELYALRNRQQAAEARLGQAEEKLRQVEEVERDPLAWADSLMQRHPRLRPEVPW
jgi:hypothetical protein